MGGFQGQRFPKEENFLESFYVKIRSKPLSFDNSEPLALCLVELEDENMMSDWAHMPTSPNPFN